MSLNNFVPQHINATTDDIAGNAGIGRYIFLPGSDGRAKQIAEQFSNLSVKTHTRGHHLYLGSIRANGHDIDVAAISSGMGCPSMEIILHELYHLGGKRFLRVGSSGSLQHHTVRKGDLINVQASVRDESTTTDYIPINVPAIASFDFITAISRAATILNLEGKTHTGVVHCKSSLYAREFGAGPRQIENKAYIDMLTRCGVLASEMESAALFVQSQVYNYELAQMGKGPAFKVLAGALLGIFSAESNEFILPDQEKEVVYNMISLALESVKCLAIDDMSFTSGS